MKINDILKKQESYRKAISDFSNAIISQGKWQSEQKIWEEKASQSKNPVVQCLFKGYEEMKAKHNEFLNTELMSKEIVPSSLIENESDITSIMLSDDDKFFLVKAIESGGICDIKSLYEWTNRRMKGVVKEIE